jgi:ribosomal protein L21E
MFDFMNERNKTGSKLRIGDVIHRFSNGDKVKVVVSKTSKNYHHKRKGSVGTVIKTAISQNKPCYWIIFADEYEEWFEEWELNGV